MSNSCSKDFKISFIINIPVMSFGKKKTFPQKQIITTGSGVFIYLKSHMCVFQHYGLYMLCCYISFLECLLFLINCCFYCNCQDGDYNDDHDCDDDDKRNDDVRVNKWVISVIFCLKKQKQNYYRRKFPSDTNPFVHITIMLLPHTPSQIWINV